MAYDKYYGKHFSRKEGLLQACKIYKPRFGKKKIKYFTLCAKEAIDIFMLEKENILTRNGKGKLTDVVICEKIKEDADEIFSLVRPPVMEAILIGSIQDIILFEDDNHTLNRDPDEDEPSKSIRDKLKIKGLHNRFLESLPFDVINFDACGNFLGSNDRDRKLLESFKKIFELQRNTNSFILAITLPISNIHTGYEYRFKESITDNFQKFEDIKNKALEIWETTDIDKVGDMELTSLGFAKSILMKAANDNGWQTEHFNIIIHENSDLRKMMTSVVYLEKTSPDIIKEAYKKDVKKIITNMPSYISFEDSENDEDLKDHLKSIIDYREKFKN